MGEKCEQEIVSHEVYVPCVLQKRRVSPPWSVLVSTGLYCAEFISAAVLCSEYSSSGDRFWLALTLTFMLLHSVLTQLALTFLHRDLDRDRPLVLFLHLLLMGPIVRCIEALAIYIQAGKEEEPYVTISRKIKLNKGHPFPVEREVGHSESKLAAHRNAFKRSAVIQAFLGSTPQLTLQLYATIQDKYLLPTRVALIFVSLLSIVYGALVCSVLAIQIKHDDYMVRIRPLGYVCLVLWRGLEIATRTTVLVLFSTALPYWVAPLGLTGLLFFFLLPWVELWQRRASLPESGRKDQSQAGTVLALCLLTFLYAFINIFCYSVLQLDLASWEVIEKRMRWAHLAAYYTVRLLENAALAVAWYYFRSDFYTYVCTPLLLLQLLVCYGLAALFMLIFYQYCHPFRHQATHSVFDCHLCGCCHRPRPLSPTPPIVAADLPRDYNPVTVYDITEIEGSDPIACKL